MWYFAWILGTLLACAFGIITALALEHVAVIKMDEENTNKAYYKALHRDE